MKCIDTHIHVWNLQQASYDWLKNDTSLLHRNYNIEELTPQIQEAGVTEGILVQAACDIRDTDWMLQVAAATPWITGVVGWLPLTNTALTEKLLEAYYSHQTYFKGIRHLIHDEADAQWLLQSSVINSLKVLVKYGLPYDVVGVLPQHIETALEVAARVPGLRMVFDHMNQPPVASKEKFGRWGQLMQQAAANEQFYIKISGLGTTAQNPHWQAEDIQPYIAFVLEHFGEDRCFLGGDWPVSLLAGSYADTWHKYRKALQQTAGEAAQQKLAYTNAQRFYNL
ncbi:L-fuconolactonase [Filimonas lacunae]|uniref:L-fuconolactonase n=1 Tax=Filimonas lacunae TaxID=477680 RepID=A0A173MC45_9BACT|nr:amidohydrolase family protein [Filimonas lacunae]BAV05153.1 L-fuconolactone hydrolase [Filimonas lacunae]SIT34146.1 L-fuconolactonase [Filimonas lacunae]